MPGTHGPSCNAKTFPTNCPSCKSNVYFFQCDHQSRVFFDDLGPPWPLHFCFLRRNGSRQFAPRPSGKVALTTMTNVTVSVQSQNYGLLTGMEKSIDNAIVKRAGQKPDSSLRDTMRIDPIGDRSDHLCGVVHDIVQLPLDEKFGIELDTLGGQTLSKRFPDLKVAQLTILVDEIATDPDAIDFLSYTIWCNPTAAVETLSKRHIVSLTVTPTEIWGIGRRWLGSNIERLL